MTFQGRREARRAEAKAALLGHLLEAQQAGEPVRLNDLALLLHRSRAGLTVLWHELAEEGQVDYPAEARRNNGRQEVGPPHDLAERIAAVQEAKFKRWEKTGKMHLRTADLDEVLPCPED